MNQQEKTLINKELESKISTMLRDLGISSNLKGYKYLQSAILLCIKDCTLIYNLSTKLYPTLAKEYNSTSSAAERAIRLVINGAWQKDDSKLIKSMFGHAIKPTNSEFLATIVDELTPKQKLEKEISTMLRNLGIRCNLLGYQYLQSAILLCIKDRTLVNNVLKLYLDIAKTHKTTASRVERAIRHAIEVAWQNDSNLINSIFEHLIVTERNPTNSEFIATIVDELTTNVDEITLKEKIATSLDELTTKQELKEKIATSLDELTTKQELKEKIATMLWNLGVPYHQKSYEYLENAILLFMEERTFVDQVTTGLSSVITKNYNTISSRGVEHIIRHAIKVAWQKFIDSTESKISSAKSEFIATIADEITTNADEITTNADEITTNADEITINADEITTKKELKNNISTMLRDLGIPCNLLGYQYLQSAIFLCMEDFTLIEYITKGLYPTIAKKHETTASRVERAIRHAIEVAWRNDSNLINSIFEHLIVTERNPTNSEFIATIVDELTTKQELEKKIAKKLRNLGIPCNLLGYQYLQSAILLCMEDFTFINYITKDLYPEIAEKHKTRSSNVERAIRHAIEVAWKRADLELINSIFGCKDSRPTNSEFIATLTTKLNEII